MKLRIEPMQPEDWPAVRAIYEEGIQGGLATFETSAPDWAAWNEGHLPMCRLVARYAAQQEIAGWAALSPISRRAAYAGVAEVSIYVAGWARGEGVGRALLEELIVQSEQAGLWTLRATIFAVNTASQKLHSACGFSLIGRHERIAQREGVWHDTVVMERRSPVVGR